VPIKRGGDAGTVCFGENACLDEPAVGDVKAGAGAGAAAGAGSAANRNAGGSGPFRLPPIPSPPVSPLVLAALALLVALALAAMRYLSPNTAGQVWRRTAVLSRLGGVRQLPGETPLQFGSRLAGALPEAALPIRALADNFAVAAYAPPSVAARRRDAIMSGWLELRPALLKRIALRLGRRV
jgi:hypothetical protein